MFEVFFLLPGNNDDESKKGIVHFFKWLSSKPRKRIGIERGVSSCWGERTAVVWKGHSVKIKVCKALDEFIGDKAPCTDGFTLAIWHNCWGVIQTDILDFLHEFYSHGTSKTSLNATFLVPISKKGGRKKLNILDLSLCWRFYTSYWQRFWKISSKNS